MYIDMEPWRERVLKERTELIDKIRKLEKFFGTSQFDLLPATDRAILKTQHQVMESYAQILMQRVIRDEQKQVDLEAGEAGKASEGAEE